MLRIAAAAHPDLELVRSDAYLEHVPTAPVSGLLARYSLIHVPPREVPDVLAAWADRTEPGTPVLVAVQASDTPGQAIAFDHAVAPAWRWHPDELARVVEAGGFDEQWRLVTRPCDGHRFPEVHLLALRR